MKNPVWLIPLAFWVGWFAAIAFGMLMTRLQESPEVRREREKKAKRRALERACRKGKHPEEWKRYVSIQDETTYYCRWHSLSQNHHCCSFCYRVAEVQIVRWECGGCGGMGITSKDKEYGLWKLHHGELVPDPKAWANTEER